MPYCYAALMPTCRLMLCHAAYHAALPMPSPPLIADLMLMMLLELLMIADDADAAASDISSPPAAADFSFFFFAFAG